MVVIGKTISKLQKYFSISMLMCRYFGDPWEEVDLEQAQQENLPFGCWMVWLDLKMKLATWLKL